MLDRCTITLGCGRMTVGEYGVARSSLVSASGIRLGTHVPERICIGKPRSSAMYTWQGTLGAEMIRSAAKGRSVRVTEASKVERYSDLNVGSKVL